MIRRRRRRVRNRSLQQLLRPSVILCQELPRPEIAPLLRHLSWLIHHLVHGERHGVVLPEELDILQPPLAENLVIHVDVHPASVAERGIRVELHVELACSSADPVEEDTHRRYRLIGRAPSWVLDVKVVASSALLVGDMWQDLGVVEQVG